MMARRALADSRKVLAYSRCSALSSLREQNLLGHPDHTVHRRADLVAHRRQKLRLGPRGLHRGFERAGELVLCALPLGRIPHDAENPRFAADLERLRDDLGGEAAAVATAMLGFEVGLGRSGGRIPEGRQQRLACALLKVAQRQTQQLVAGIAVGGECGFVGIHDAPVVAAHEQDDVARPLVKDPVAPRARRRRSCTTCAKRPSARSYASVSAHERASSRSSPRAIRCVMILI